MIPVLAALVATAVSAPVAVLQQPGVQQQPPPPPPIVPPAYRGLTALERRAGWRLLYDGATFAGWRGAGRGDVPQTGWEILQGTIHDRPGGGGGDLITLDQYGDFELEFQWGVAVGANSGVKYWVHDSSGRNSTIGPEYQCVDDLNVPEAQEEPKHAAGALYDIVAAGPKRLSQPATFNHGRILVQDGRIEHWVNGQRTVETLVGSPEWQRAFADSKFADDVNWPTDRHGHISLQDHSTECWFRDLRLRDLDALPGTAVELFDGKSLAGWREVGDAKYTIEDGTLLAEVGGGSQSFLVTEREYGDFLLDLEVRPEDLGNSGIQVRSHQRPEGTVHGYQIEIDPSPRAWSGGLYEEAGRGWLQDLSQNPAAQKALHLNEWNRYHIECVGPLIRAWINGIPTTYWYDCAELSGFVALQVHSGKDTKVRFRNVRLQDLGRSEPTSVFDGVSLDGWTQVGHSWSAFDGQIAGLMEAVSVEQLQANPPTPGIGSLTTDARYGDFTLRCKMRLIEGDFRLLARWQGSWKDALQLEQVAPGLWGGVRGWNIDLTQGPVAALLKKGEWNDVCLTLYGDHLVLIVNGQHAIDRRDNPFLRFNLAVRKRQQGDTSPEPPFVDAPEAGHLGFWQSQRVDATGFVKDVEILGAPVE